MTRAREAADGTRGLSKDDVEELERQRCRLYNPADDLAVHGPGPQRLFRIPGRPPPGPDQPHRAGVIQ